MDGGKRPWVVRNQGPALATAVIVYSSFPPIWKVSLATELPTADVPAVVRLRTT